MANITTFGKKAAAAALVAVTLGAGFAASTGEAEARYGRKGLIAAGVIGALAVGAIAASAAEANRHPGYYHDPGYDYAPAAPVYYQQTGHVYYQQPEPVYYGHSGYYGHPGYHHRRHVRNRYPGYSETGFAYRGPVCKIRKERVFDGYGYRVERYQVCR